MKSALSFVGVAVLVGLGFAAGLWAGRSERVKLTTALQAVNAAIAQLEVTRDSLSVAMGRSSAVADTVWTTRWLPARARVASLPVDRPVPYPVYVATVAAADTTIAACQRARQDCAAVVAQDSALIDSLRRRGQLLERAAQGPRLTLWGHAETDLERHWYVGGMLRARLPLVPLTGYLRASARVDSLAARDVRIGAEWRF